MCSSDLRGDIVTIFGRDGNARVAAEKLADIAESVPDEMLSNLNKRVPRLYTRSGKVAARTDYIG